jgi:hypothetical protein
MYENRYISNFCKKKERKNKNARDFFFNLLLTTADF